MATIPTDKHRAEAHGSNGNMKGVGGGFLGNNTFGNIGATKSNSLFGQLRPVHQRKQLLKVLPHFGRGSDEFILHNR